MAKAKDIEVARDLLRDLSFCVFDLETTGGNQKKDKIIEIGLVKIEKLKIVEKKSFLIDPEIRIPDFIQKLTSIQQSDVEGKPIIDQRIDEILNFMGDSILVAHNTSFDIPFFNSVLERLNRPTLNNRNLCTNLMTKYLIPNLMNTNLNYMSKIFDIEHSKAHRALDDAEATARLLLKYLDIFITKNISKINHLYYPLNRFELDRANYKKAAHYTGKRIINDISEKLDELTIPYLIAIKGDNGLIQFALPCLNNSQCKGTERQLIFDKLETLDWQTVTIRLFGPFIECLINYNSLFCKMAAEERNAAIKYLWATHFPTVDQRVLKTAEEEIGDFIVFNHLVPEQFVIYPTSALNQNSRLIFRYPGHKKKLLQFLKSRIGKLNDGKMRKANFCDELKEFVDYYLIQAKFRHSGIMLFNRQLPQNEQEQFVAQLEQFLSKNHSPFAFPKEHI